MSQLLKGTSIFLIGMMGSGKTTVGQLLAQRLQYRFFDTDVLIEKVAGCSISQIFAEAGEASFRQLESQVLSELAACARSVVATGGGIVLERLNWSYLHHGLVVWLEVPIGQLQQRLQQDTTRPLLQGENLEAKLTEIFSQRQKLYAQADVRLQVGSEETPEQVVDRVLAAIIQLCEQKAEADASLEILNRERPFQLIRTEPQDSN